MKLVSSLALMALLVVIVATSINCVQNTTTPQPSANATATPTLSPSSYGTLTGDQEYAYYTIAIEDPYVRERVLSTAWRSTQEIGGKLVRNTTYNMGIVAYMSFTEYGPDYKRYRVLPAVEIIPGNASQAGINVVAFIDPEQKRVAYIGFVPRVGVAPAEGVTYTSIDAGVDESEPAWGSVKQYNNVTVVYTGYVDGMTLTQDQKDRAAALTIVNATVQGYIDGHTASTSNISVYSYETGYPYRYILAYPMVTIDVTDGPVRYDTVFVLVDLINSRVVRVEHGEKALF